MRSQEGQPFRADFPAAQAIGPASNFDERKAPIDTIILHYTGMPSCRGAVDWLLCEESRVSCHYVVDEEGSVFQLLPEQRRAWHAGVSVWRGRADLNSRSIGIEIANPGHDHGYPEFPDVQIAAVIELCRNCGERWAIAPENVLAHSDVAPTRKQDPGEKFPWRTLYEAGVGHWVQPAALGGGRFLQRGDGGQPVEAWQSMLSYYGYGVDITGEFCALTEAVTIAFQRHFRPQRVDGIADRSTIDTLHRLIGAVPALRAAQP